MTHHRSYWTRSDGPWVETPLLSFAFDMSALTASEPALLKSKDVRSTIRRNDPRAEVLAEVIRTDEGVFAYVYGAIDHASLTALETASADAETRDRAKPFDPRRA
jgi:hypothetical protein